MEATRRPPPGCDRKAKRACPDLRPLHEPITSHAHLDLVARDVVLGEVALEALPEFLDRVALAPPAMVDKEEVRVVPVEL